MDCFGKISYELNRAIDKHSRMLISANIELFLGYCIRFYDRQFITRDQQNSGVVESFNTLLMHYIGSDDGKNKGIPTVAYFAGELNLSPN